MQTSKILNHLKIYSENKRKNRVKKSFIILSWSEDKTKKTMRENKCEIHVQCKYEHMGYYIDF